MVEALCHPGKEWVEPTLTGAMRSPLYGGVPKQIVFYFHGYGGCGETNIWFAEALQQSMPHAVIYAPDGLEKIDGQDDRRKWYSHPDPMCIRYLSLAPHERSDEKKQVLMGLYEAYQNAAPEIISFIRERMAFHDLDFPNVYLIGCSQGAIMLSQLMAESDILARQDGKKKLMPVGGVMVLAGCLINEDAVLEHPSKARPPFILFHGGEDINVPFPAHQRMEKILEEVAIPVTSRVFPELDHTWFEQKIIDSVKEYAAFWGAKANL